MKTFRSAGWNGGLREGKGSVSTESRALESYPYTFFSRYGEKPGTNPEELLGRLTPLASPCRSSDYSAWRTSCRSRSTANRKSSSTRTAMAFPSPRSITVTAKIRGIDQAAFQSIAAKAKAGCPVSKLMKVEIGFGATSSGEFALRGGQGGSPRCAPLY